MSCPNKVALHALTFSLPTAFTIIYYQSFWATAAVVAVAFFHFLYKLTKGNFC